MKKQRKKQFLSILCIAVMLTGLCACGETAPPADAGNNGQAEQQEVQAESMESITIDGTQLGMGLAAEEAAAAAEDQDPDREIDRAVEPIRPVPDSMLDGTPLSEAHYYYRGLLGAKEQQAYDLLRAGMRKGETKIKMTVPIPKEDIFEIYKSVIYDGADLFWAETNGMKYWYNNKGQVTFLEPGYNDLVKDIEGSTATMEAAAAEALADMWSLGTEAEKAKYAHDYLTHSIDYTYDAPYNQTAYSALVNGQTVCAGYAHGFQYLMQKMGIPCAYVLGYAQGGYHAWNLVLLEDEHYMMDVTWDDPLGASPDSYRYNYFNLTEAAMGVDHIRAEVSQPLPLAEGEQCSFENAFGGDAYGTDFAGIVGEMPAQVTGEGNKYIG